jgi:hypothetical protein
MTAQFVKLFLKSYKNDFVEFDLNFLHGKLGTVHCKYSRNSGKR